MNSHRSDETWLGGDPQGKWSNHYELLGLPCGFNDTVVIARVADQLMKRIRMAAKRDNDVDRLRVIAKSVLDAKSCLTDPKRKERYDTELQAQHNMNSATETESLTAMANSNAEEDIPLAIPVAVPLSNGAPDTETASLPFQATERPPSILRARRRSRLWLTLATVAVGAGLFTALALLSKRYLLDNETLPGELRDTASSEASVDPTDAAAAAGSSQVDVLDAQGSQTANAPSAATNQTTTTEPPHDGEPNEDEIVESDVEETRPTRPEPAPLTRAEAQGLSRALTTAKRSLSLREFHAAAESLAQAREIARHPPHQDLVERLEELKHYAQEFWAGLDDAWNSLSAGMELQVGKRIVNVVEVGPDDILVRVDGKNRRYFRDKLPSSLQKSIIESWLDPSAPSSDVIRGAFHATQDPPHKQAARQYWESAQQRGAGVEKLTATLTDSYAVEDLLGDDSSD